MQMQIETLVPARKPSTKPSAASRRRSPSSRRSASTRAAAARRRSPRRPRGTASIPPCCWRSWRTPRAATA